MCAGLYPNIARIRLSPEKSSKRPCLLETKFEKRILIHPRSINAKLRVNHRIDRSLSFLLFRMMIFVVHPFNLPWLFIMKRSVHRASLFMK